MNFLSRATVVFIFFLAVACTPAPPAKISGAPKVHSGQIYLIRGLADVFSTGLDSLAVKLANEGIAAKSVSLSRSAARAASIASKYKAGASNRPVILAGHSYGADEALRVAAELEKLKIPVALLVTIDPTIKGPVTGNVRRAVNLHSNPSGIWGPISAVPGYKGRLVNRDVRNGDAAIEGTNHFNIEERSAIHQIIIREIKAALRGQ